MGWDFEATLASAYEIRDIQPQADRPQARIYLLP
jgi:hypothetical protein